MSDNPSQSPLDRGGPMSLGAVKEMKANQPLGPVAPESSEGFTKYGDNSRHSYHSYSRSEVRIFVRFMNMMLGRDPGFAAIPPVNEEDQSLFSVVRQGLLIPKLLVAMYPHLDVKALGLTTTPPLSPAQVMQNHAACIHAACSVGCNISNIGSSDFMSGTPHLILAYLWNLIQTWLLQNVSPRQRPQLLAFEDVTGTMDPNAATLSPSQSAAALIAWVNHHLQNTGTDCRIHNFSDSIQDGRAYLLLLTQITPPSLYQFEPIDFNAISSAERAQLVCQVAQRLNVIVFVAPEDILEGDPNLNLAFTAELFRNYPVFRLAGNAGNEAAAAAQPSKKQPLAQQAHVPAQPFGDPMMAAQYSHPPPLPPRQDNTPPGVPQGYYLNQPPQPYVQPHAAPGSYYYAQQQQQQPYYNTNVGLVPYQQQRPGTALTAPSNVHRMPVQPYFVQQGLPAQAPRPMSYMVAAAPQQQLMYRAVAPAPQPYGMIVQAAAPQYMMPPAAAQAPYYIAGPQQIYQQTTTTTVRGAAAPRVVQKPPSPSQTYQIIRRTYTNY